MKKLRIKFSKHGAMIFVGHLDIMRYFQKAMRRAEIDISYSEGFNPHQIMSFAAPLGVGIYSNGEYLDIQVESTDTSDAMKQRLNQVMAVGIEVLSVKELPEQAGNAMASVMAAAYTVRFRKGREPEFDYRSQLEKFYKQDSIFIIKKTKKSEKEIDLKPFLYECKSLEGEDGIYLLVNASSSGNIKPTLVMDAFYQLQGMKPGDFDFLITREETYTFSEQGAYVPLDDIGAELL